MSNLLKKHGKSEVAAFGFPALGGGEYPGGNGEDFGAGQTDSPNAEEMYRRKLLELERRSQEIEREAYGKGFAQGERDGLEYGQKTVQVIKSQIERIAGDLETLPEKIFSDYRSWFITASLRIARRIVGREVSLSPEIVANTLNMLLDEAEENSTLSVYLHPLDLEFMEKRVDLIMAPRGKHFSVKPDETVQRGGCRVESDIQLLDASIDRQFEILEKYLQGRAKEPDRVPEVNEDG